MERTGEHALEHRPACWEPGATAQLCARRAVLTAAKPFCAAWHELQLQLLLAAWPQGNPSLWESLWPLSQPAVSKQGDKPGVVDVSWT